MADHTDPPTSDTPAAIPESIDLIARGVLIHEGRVLLCKSLAHGYHYLPGGHIDPGESAAEAVGREYEEECGLRVEAGECLAIVETRFTQHGRPKQELTLLFEVGVFHVEHPGDDAPGAGGGTTDGESGRGGGGGGPGLSERLASIRSRESHIGFVWVDLAAIPETDVRPGWTKAWLLGGGQPEPGTERPLWFSTDER